MTSKSPEEVSGRRSLCDWCVGQTLSIVTPSGLNSGSLRDNDNAQHDLVRSRVVLFPRRRRRDVVLRKEPDVDKDQLSMPLKPNVLEDLARDVRSPHGLATMPSTLELDSCILHLEETLDMPRRSLDACRSTSRPRRQLPVLLSMCLRTWQEMYVPPMGLPQCRRLLSWTADLCPRLVPFCLPTNRTRPLSSSSMISSEAEWYFSRGGGAVMFVTGALDKPSLSSLLPG
jgi:hypothetical protein